MLRDWWTAEDNERFQKRGRPARRAVLGVRARCPGAHVNGQLTLGENIGDLAGLAVAYKAYQLSLGGQHRPGDRRLHAATSASSSAGPRCGARKYRDDELRKRLLTDPHSPSEYRGNGIARNMPQFVQAFGVKPGDKLYLPPEQVVRIW